jgi:hypothetical protein
MYSSPHLRSKTRNSFVALLLQPTLHNFSAVAPLNRLDGITYRRNGQKTHKSNAALLLPLFVPVSPLLRYSYKKMGGVPHALRSFSEGGFPWLPPGLIRNYQCFLSLTKNIAHTQKKDPNVFYHLRTTSPVSTCVFYLLRKRRGGS